MLLSIMSLFGIFYFRKKERKKGVCNIEVTCNPQRALYELFIIKIKYALSIWEGF